MKTPEEGFDFRRDMTEAQLDGRACFVCASEDGYMYPLGTLGDTQLFVHKKCEPRCDCPPGHIKPPHDGTNAYDHTSGCPMRASLGGRT